MSMKGRWMGDLTVSTHYLARDAQKDLLHKEDAKRQNFSTEQNNSIVHEIDRDR